MLPALKRWWAARTPAFRAAANTAWMVFVGVLLPILLGLVNEVTEWATNQRTNLPDLRVLGKASVAAVSSASTFMINYLFRRWKPPSFDPRKQEDVHWVTSE